MSAPVAHKNGHSLPLDTLVCSCGEWSAEAGREEFRRIAFEAWKWHAESAPILEAVAS